MASEPSLNSLGLDFDQLEQSEYPKIEQDPAVTALGPGTHAKANADSKEKKKPYVNPERVKTGGTPRDKLSDEELAERMARIKEQNEKIKQRRLDVKADEDAFKETQELERRRQAHNRKVQEHVDRTREQNVRRKMDKIQSREWDSGKPLGDWKQSKTTNDDISNAPEVISDRGNPILPLPTGSISSSRGRGFGRGRGKGRGGRGGGSTPNNDKAGTQAVGIGSSLSPVQIPAAEAA